MTRRIAPGLGLSAGVSLRSTAEAPMTTGKATMLAAAAQPTARGATLLRVGCSAVRVLLAALMGAPATDEPAGMVP